jgi:lysophospholipid acyltransferase (LPLAT)-like uncharacterized protein
MIMKRFLIERVLPRLLCGVLRLWCLTLRVRRINPENEDRVYSLPGRFILTLWHGRIFYLFYHLRNHPDYHLLISPSRDGEFLARLAILMGYSVIRGSSFKKAVPSARSLIKVLNKEERIIMIADGSRGPRQKAQAGSLQIAGITGAPLIPMSYGASRRHVFGSWDRFVLPLPFSRVTVNFGEPLHLPPRMDEATLQEKQAELENALNRLTEESE